VPPRLIVERDFVDLPEIQVVRAQPPERVLELAHGDLAVAPVRADLRHQERLLATAGEGLAHSLFAHAVVVVPRVVEERDARVDGLVHQADGVGVGLRHDHVPAAHAENRHAHAGAAERTGRNVGGGFRHDGHLTPTSGAELQSPLQRFSSARRRTYSYRMPLLTFLGAARTVTGSRHLVETGGHRVLVDCGLFQGSYELRRRNWDDLPVKADTIDAVVLTHAHLDHVGYLPRLVKQGFRGRVFCTGGTQDLAHLILVDSAHLQEEDAQAGQPGHYSKHDPAEPLYSVADAWSALSKLQPVGYDRPMPVVPGMEVSFVPMGHLLGAAAVVMKLTDPAQTIVFGGDLGRYQRPVMPDPQPIQDADVLLCESTYGDRLHEPDDQGAKLARSSRRLPRAAAR
jgi:glyoxylase-like metal-dependent hydrolase (beta-lactamase superfamily II)